MIRCPLYLRQVLLVGKLETGILVACQRVRSRGELVPRCVTNLCHIRTSVKCRFLALPNLEEVGLVVENFCIDLVPEPDRCLLVDLILHDLGLTLYRVVSELLGVHLLVADHPLNVDGPNGFGLLFEVGFAFITDKVVLVTHVRMKIVARGPDDFEASVSIMGFVTAKDHLIGPLIETVEATILILTRLF